MNDRPKPESAFDSDTKIAAAIREAVQSELPPASPELRETILQALADNQVHVSRRPNSVPEPKSSSKRRLWWVAIASAAVVLIALAILFQPWNSSRSEVASNSDSDRKSAAASRGFAKEGDAEIHDYHDTFSDNDAYMKKSMEYLSPGTSDPKDQKANESYMKKSSEYSRPNATVGASGEINELAIEELPDGIKVYNVGDLVVPNLSTGQTVRAKEVEPRARGMLETSSASIARTELMTHDRRTEELDSNEQYEAISENPFVEPAGASALSTFSIDVDTASYANVRRFLSNGVAPPPDAVRIEELINYFSYDYPQPDGEVPFSVNMEVASCPWSPGNRLLRVGLKAKEIDRHERPASNIVFLLDVSGSMQAQDKLPLLKQGLMMMVDQLSENDRVSIVTYASGTGVRLLPTSGDQKQKIRDSIAQLSAGGSTHGSAGIQMAYDLAGRNFLEEGTNRVILATDGDLNVGITKDDDLVRLIKEKAEGGVFLTVLGFGTGNLKDSKMEKLADNGNGVYAYIDGMREARKVLVEQISGNLVTVAKDVKLQIEFNPAEVKAYRLIGYENRALAAKDFDDDKKDAGEIGAGHTVTALYELVPAHATADIQLESGEQPKLKYQRTAEPQPNQAKVELNETADSGELLTLALRYKLPEATESSKIEFTLTDNGQAFNKASTDFRFAASVASFGMLLRHSQHAGGSTYSAVEEIALSSLGEDKSGYRAEFLELVRRAEQFVR